MNPRRRHRHPLSPFIAGINAKSKIFPTSTSKRPTCRERTKIQPRAGVCSNPKDSLRPRLVDQEEAAELLWENLGAGSQSSCDSRTTELDSFKVHLVHLPSVQMGRLRPRVGPVLVQELMERQGLRGGGAVLPGRHRIRSVRWHIHERPAPKVPILAQPPWASERGPSPL